MAESESGSCEPPEQQNSSDNAARYVEVSGNIVRYDASKSYRWNYDHPPDLPVQEGSVSDASVSSQSNISSSAGPSSAAVENGGGWDFMGIPVASPLGIAAGPLLNSAWCLYYAARGFDVLTYKTVRSSARECYEMPNLVPVQSSKMCGDEAMVKRGERMNGSWAVSFGMPSSSPEVWRRDVEFTRECLRHDQVLSVSVVGSQQDGWGLEELASDYAKCASWAAQSGADVIEANFSCPNVMTCDGQLYQDADQARLVASEIRGRIGDVPLVIKIGYQPDLQSARELVRSLDGVVDGLSMTNSLAASVADFDGGFLFDGERRGICGDAIFHASCEQVERFSNAVVESGSAIKLIGVGGVHAAEQVAKYLAAGASACHLATAVMTDPEIGLRLSSSFRASA